MGRSPCARLPVLAACLFAGWLVPAVAAADGGSWTPAAAMSVPRTQAAAATLTDGRVLVAGGKGAAGQLLASAEIYDPATNRWSAAAPMPQPEMDAAAAPLPGDRVLVTGQEAGGSSAPPRIYDAATNTWSSVPAPLGDISFATVSPLPQGRVLVVSGTDAEIYDPAAGAWSWAPSTGEGIGTSVLGAPGDSATLADGEVIVTNGAPEPMSGFSEIYDPASNTWAFSEGPDLWTGSSTQSSDGPTAAIGDGHVLAVGGSGSESASALTYDPVQHGWVTATPLPAPRQDPVAATLPGDRVLVAGGVSGGEPTASAVIYTAPAQYGTVADVGFARVVGVPVVGHVLTATGGSGEEFEFQWQRCSGTSCVVVSGPTGPIAGPSRYRVTSADAGSTLRVEVATMDASGTHALYAGVDFTGTVVAPTLGFTTPGISLSSSDAPEAAVTTAPSDLPQQVSYRVAPAPGSIATFAPYVRTLNIPPALAWGPSFVSLPLFDHGVPILTREVTVQLLDPVGAQLGPITTQLVKLCDAADGCGAGTPRDPRNPLELPTAPPSRAPLDGARFSADYQASPAARAAQTLKASDPRGARLLAEIALQPNVERFGAWSGAYPGRSVASYLARVHQQDPGTVPMLSTYRVVDGHCGGWSDPLADQAAYHAWITSFAEGIGYSPAVVFLEMDSLITTGCLSRHGLDVRLAELRDAIHVLSELPHAVVYLDAGAGDALPAARAASLLRRAGVAGIQGFFLNSTHFDWTRHEIAYGERISRMLGGKHFVINTAENGRGPLVPRDRAHEGNEILCDPPGRGLGPLPSWHTGFRNVDAFAWIANPGESGGQCRPGAPPSGRFWTALAIELARHADFRVR